MQNTQDRSLLSLTRTRGRGLLFAALFFSIFTNLLMLTGPLFMLQVYDRVLGSRSEETLVALFGLVALLYLLYWLLEFARSRVMARIGARFQSAMDTPIFRAALERSALRSGPAKGSLQDLDAVRTLYSSPIILALFDAPWTPLFLIMIFVFHPLLGWLAVSGGVLLIAIAILNQALTARKTAQSTQLSVAAQKFARQSEEGSEVIWAQGMLPAMSARWDVMQNKMIGEALGAHDWTGSFSSFTKAFRLFLQSAILALGAWLVLQNQVTAGAMIAASILLGRALAPIEVAISQWALLQRGLTGWRNLRETLAETPERTPSTPLPHPEARLSVDNVSVVVRQGDKPVLQQVSLKLEPGDALGVIGLSGSGKTTLARVVVGLIRPVTGEVRFAGATLDQYGADRLGQYIGYLPQDVRLFDGTVAENIAQMETDPDPEKIVAAARKANVHDIVLRLPDGYGTNIGALDSQLSGGQKQRLALARALYNDPVLLVLDEPNSALDAEGSKALNEVIHAMKVAKKCVLIMTHRPSAITACDKLLVLENGKPAGFGPRDDVIRSMMKNAQDVQRAVKTGAG